MVLTLYLMYGSAPCHQVMLTAKVLNLDLDIKNIDLFTKEQLSPEFIKINPQHVVPTLVDGDFAIWESRAISRYLVNKYGAGSKLYPQDPLARAIVDQRLDFDLGTLYQRFADYYYPQFFENKEPEELKLKRLEEALGFLNIFLEGNVYTAGADLTIADLAIVASISVFDAVGVVLKEFSNVERWFELMKKTIPEYQDIVQKNVDVFKAIADERKSKKD